MNNVIHDFIFIECINYHKKTCFRKDTGLIDAASKGATAAIPLVLNIIANIVGFVSFIALVNSLLSWVGSLVGYEKLSFEVSKKEKY